MSVHVPGDDDDVEQLRRVAVRGGLERRHSKGALRVEARPASSGDSRCFPRKAGKTYQAQIWKREDK